MEDFFASPQGKGKGKGKVNLNDAYNAQFPMSLIAERGDQQQSGQSANRVARGPLRTGLGSVVGTALSNVRSRGLSARLLFCVAQEFTTGARLFLGGLEAAESAMGPKNTGRITFIVDCRGDQTIGRHRTSRELLAGRSSRDRGPRNTFRRTGQAAKAIEIFGRPVRRTGGIPRIPLNLKSAVGVGGPSSQSTGPFGFAAGRGTGSCRSRFGFGAPTGSLLRLRA